MENFVYSIPTKIYFGKGQIKKTAGHHNAFRGTKHPPEQAVQRMKEKGAELLSGMPVVNQDSASPVNQL